MKNENVYPLSLRVYGMWCVVDWGRTVANSTDPIMIHWRADMWSLFHPINPVRQSNTHLSDDSDESYRSKHRFFEPLALRCPPAPDAPGAPVAIPPALTAGAARSAAALAAPALLGAADFRAPWYNWERNAFMSCSEDPPAPPPAPLLVPITIPMLLGVLKGRGGFAGGFSSMLAVTEAGEEEASDGTGTGNRAAVGVSATDAGVGAVSVAVGERWLVLLPPAAPIVRLFRLTLFFSWSNNDKAAPELKVFFAGAVAGAAWAGGGDRGAAAASAASSMVLAAGSFGWVADIFRCFVACFWNYLLVLRLLEWFVAVCVLIVVGCRHFRLGLCNTLLEFAAHCVRLHWSVQEPRATSLGQKLEEAINCALSQQLNEHRRSWGSSLLFTYLLVHFCTELALSRLWWAGGSGWQRRKYLWILDRIAFNSLAV